MMMTIYEKESLFESLDATFCVLKAYVEGAVGREELHEVEANLFRKLQSLGREFMEVFIAMSGTGYEPGNPPLSEDGSKMAYKGVDVKGSPYMSIFGEVRLYRAGFAHPDGGRYYPIDVQLNLPDHKYSYLLLKWLQKDSAEADFRSCVEQFNEIFDFSFFPDLPHTQGMPIAEYVEPFYDQQEAPPSKSEGSHIAISADCKGVRILKSEREAPESVPELAAPEKARRGKGEKPGIKKDAVVVTDFSFSPEAREPEEIVKGLLNQFTQEEKEQKKQDRQARRKQGQSQPREPQNKHVFATLEGKKAAFAHLLDRVEKRDPQGQKPLVVLLDGAPALKEQLLNQLETRHMAHRVDAIILDIIHASEYLWSVATALYGEKDQNRVHWMEQKLYALMDSKVGYVIGGLKQIRTKNRLSLHQKNVIQKTITYFENHLHMMNYATYLRKGYPIATGVIEGTCGSLVKDRMEQSGMRWSIAGAQAVLAQRAVVKNGDWDHFFTYFIDSERQRLYPTVYDRDSSYKNAA